ncbi:MAG: helix-turn-helix transcriptional regulator [Clostridia bacterium]|nr:helix-turn-helix transcriptional regulator [Clostridia bacterium]MBQ3093406.1 helix-turn-helix transcriptional regulator [Clostridia bacterium]
MSSIADNIRKFRVYRGMTQQQVADALELDRSTYCYYESGRINPDVRTLFSLAEVFDVDCEELLESESSANLAFADDNTKNYEDDFEEFEPELELSESEKNLVFGFRAVSYDSKKQILDIINKEIELE